MQAETTIVQEKRDDLFQGKEHYLAFKKRWATIAQTQQNNVVLHVLYNALRGKDLERGFTQPTNKNKVKNGYRPAFLDAKHSAKLWCKDTNPEYIENVFAGLVTTDMLQQVAEKLENK